MQINEWLDVRDEHLCRYIIFKSCTYLYFPVFNVSLSSGTRKNYLGGINILMNSQVAAYLLCSSKGES